MTKCISVFVIAFCFMGLLSCTVLPSLPGQPAVPADQTRDRIGDFLVTRRSPRRVLHVHAAFPVDDSR